MSSGASLSGGDEVRPDTPSSSAPGALAGPPAASPSHWPGLIRASDTERDATAQRLQEAFAQGRLDDTEFDERMRAALTARTRAELAGLLADLPADSPGAVDARPPTALPATAGRPPGRFAVAFKSGIRRAGRWRLPGRFTTVVYKGSGWLDLRAAELTAPQTTLVTVAYKSRIEILVPPGVRVEAGGLGVSLATDSGPGPDNLPLPATAPVVHIQGFAYKGAIDVTTRPPAH